VKTYDVIDICTAMDIQHLLMLQDDYCELHPEEEGWIIVYSWYLLEEGDYPPRREA
jgi:hypothetical protein